MRDGPRLFGSPTFQTPSWRFGSKTDPQNARVDTKKQEESLEMVMLEPDHHCRSFALCLCRGQYDLCGMLLHTNRKGCYRDCRRIGGAGRRSSYRCTGCWCYRIVVAKKQQTTEIQLRVMGQKLCFTYSQQFGIWGNAHPNLQTTLWKPGYQCFSDWHILWFPCLPQWQWSSWLPLLVERRPDNFMQVFLLWAFEHVYTMYVYIYIHIFIHIQAV